MSLRRWLAAPVLSCLKLQAEVWESRIFSRLTELDHKLTTIAETILVRSEQRWPTTVAVMWTEGSTQLGRLLPPERPEIETLTPRSASVCCWLQPGEQQQVTVPLFTPVPRGAWLVSLGPAQLRAVHVSNQLQDRGGGSTVGRICVLGDPVELGTQLSVTLEQPSREAAYRA